MYDDDFDGLCCIKGCDIPQVAMGMCNKHWRRMKKNGSPVRSKAPPGSFRGKPSIERFLLRLKKLPDGCWQWQAGKDQDGYGCIRAEHDGVVYRRAHRFSIAYHTGVHPSSDQNVMHSCDNPSCVNPAHLSIGTVADNQRDRWAKGRGRINGAHKPAAKVTEADVLAIRASTNLQRDIAKQYGITQATVSDIRNRRSWQHVK